MPIRSLLKSVSKPKFLAQQLSRFTDTDVNHSVVLTYGLDVVHAYFGVPHSRMPEIVAISRRRREMPGAVGCTAMKMPPGYLNSICESTIN